MSGKTLSNGTLSLRFMQNAHRAKNMAEVEAQKAAIKDDAEWEVSKEVKPAWGLLNDLPPPSVTYEPSYIPFLFSNASPSSSNKTQMRGRRTFNKSGQEVIEETPPAVQDNEPKAEIPDTSNTSRTSKRPFAISGSSVSGATKSRKDTIMKAPKTEPKTAQQLVHTNSGVGTDLRPPPSARGSSSSATPFPNVFLKPSGVDEPARTSSRRLFQAATPTTRAAKRERDLMSDQKEEKRKRKKAGTDSSLPR